MRGSSVTFSAGGDIFQMSDNFNDIVPEDPQVRSDRVKAIRNAVRREEEEAWEDELSMRISKRVRSVRSSRMDAAECIIDELDSRAAEEAEAADKAAQAAAEEAGYAAGEEAGYAAEVDKLLDQIAPDRPEFAPPEKRDYTPHNHFKPSAPVSHEYIPPEEPVRTIDDTAGRNISQQPKPLRPLKKLAPLKRTTPSDVQRNEDIVREQPPVQEYAPPPYPPKRKKKKKKKKKSLGQRFLGLFPQKNDGVAERLRKLVFLGSIIAIVVCGYMVGDYYIDLWHSKRQNQEIMEIYNTYSTKQDVEDNASSYNNEDYSKNYFMLAGAKKLLDINKEVVGVISIPDTLVNNPVMQSKNNDKYLDQDIRGGEARAGEIFLDYRNNFDKVKDGKLTVANSDNLVIYGHNMANDTMFGSLKYYQRNENYYEEHPIIYLNSNYECYVYKIFAFFILDAADDSDTKYDCWNKLNFDDEDDFYDFVNEAKKRTIRTNDVDVKYGDKLITLSTCNTILGDRGRLIVMARLVRDGENLLEGTQNSKANTNIKWPNLYYQNKSASRYDPDAKFVPYGPAKTDETEE